MFADLVGWFAPSVTVDWGGEAERVGALQLTGNTFTAMGVQPYLGRGLTPQDDHPNAAPVAVLTHHYWERRFGKDAGVVGRTVLIADMPVTVVGVSAPGFSGFQPGLPCEILTPLSVHYWSHMPWDDPGFLWVQVFGHLKPGVSTEQAKAQLDVVWPQILAEMMPAGQSADPRRGSLANSVTVEPATAGRTFLRDRFEEPLRVLMAMVGLMLLIACVNTAALLLVRTVARHKEVAVRIALGAGSWHVVGQLLTESLLVVAAGASLGLLLTNWGADLIVATLARGPARYYFDAGVDFRTVAFTAALAGVTAALFSMVPAFRMSQVHSATTMRKSSSTITGGRPRLISLLVCLELALSLVMMVGAGLFVQSLSNLRATPLAFNPHNVLLLYMEPLEGGYGDTNLAAYYGDLLRRVKGLPGVADAGLGRTAPAGYFPQSLRVQLPAQPVNATPTLSPLPGVSERREGQVAYPSSEAPTATT